MGRTNVYITTDVECAEERLVRGRIQPPIGYDLRVWGRFRNQKRDLGIGLIMRELETAGLRGTFFVETVASGCFGLEGLREVCREILARGHDVQLHMHPIFGRPEWRGTGGSPLDDNFADYGLAEQVAFLREGIRTLAECGVPRDSIVGFRAGNYGANNDTWRAMGQCGLRVSSNFNLEYLGRDCGIRWPVEESDLFDTGCGVWELPITNFREPSGGYRLLQVTADSLGEMLHCLREARRLGIGHVTIVTHCFEFFHIDSPAEARGRVNRVNLARLRGLCRFLEEHPDEYRVQTVADLELPAGRSEVPAVLPRGRSGLRYLRLAQQGYKRLEGLLPLW